MSLVADNGYVDQVMWENSQAAPVRVRGTPAGAATFAPTFKDLLPAIVVVVLGLLALRWLWRATR